MSDINFKKISIHTGPQESMGFLLWRVSTQWRRLLEETLKSFNLTHPQFVVLASTGWLTQDKKIATQIEIARMAGLDANTASQILEGLEKKKFIKRTIRSCSGRAKYPIVTPLGTEVLEKALPVIEKTDTDFFSELSQGDLKIMVKLFQTLINKN